MPDLSPISDKKPEIVAPAGNPASLRAAIDAGADAVYLGFNDETNARNFEGLNFTQNDLTDAVKHIRSKKRKLYVAINTFPQKGDYTKWYASVDRAVSMGADALIIANIGVLKYARDKYPDANLHLSTQSSSSNHESINFFKKHFNIKRVILPRVLTFKEIGELKKKTDVEIEVFALGGLCINIEGRCYLSSFVTGSSTNTDGACSPSRFVRFIGSEANGLSITLNNVLLNRLKASESSPYPTCCKGRYIMPDNRESYAFEEPESLNILKILPELVDSGVVAFKIEGRQRTKSYISQMTRTLREAIDAYHANPSSYAVRADWIKNTVSAFEGAKETVGCYISK